MFSQRCRKLFVSSMHAITILSFSLSALPLEALQTHRKGILDNTIVGQVKALNNLKKASKKLYEARNKPIAEVLSGKQIVK